MDQDDHGAIALILLAHCSAISMMAIGGGVVALTPELERLVVYNHHWMSARSFIENYTLAQAAPGPNMLFVTLMGLQAAGVPGALAATVGIIGPPVAFLLAMLRFGSRLGSPAMALLLRRAVAPLSIGLMLATSWSLSRMAVDNWQGALLLVGTTVCMLRTRLNPLWLIAGGAGAGMAGWI
ncbi:MAG: chromate transporter [Pseudomonadota bacterium]|nr:chromate transporter [Pseudomonadota bacterium]